MFQKHSWNKQTQWKHSKFVFPNVIDKYYPTIKMTLVNVIGNIREMITNVAALSN